MGGNNRSVTTTNSATLAKQKAAAAAAAKAKALAAAQKSGASLTAAAKVGSVTLTKPSTVGSSTVKKTTTPTPTVVKPVVSTPSVSNLKAALIPAAPTKNSGSNNNNKKKSNNNKKPVQANGIGLTAALSKKLSSVLGAIGAAADNSSNVKKNTRSSVASGAVKKTQTKVNDAKNRVIEASKDVEGGKARVKNAPTSRTNNATIKGMRNASPETVKQNAIFVGKELLTPIGAGERIIKGKGKASGWDYLDVATSLLPMGQVVKGGAKTMKFGMSGAKVAAVTAEEAAEAGYKAGLKKSMTIAEMKEAAAAGNLKEIGDSGVYMAKDAKGRWVQATLDPKDAKTLTAAERKAAATKEADDLKATTEAEMKEAAATGRYNTPFKGTADDLKSQAKTLYAEKAPKAVVDDATKAANKAARDAKYIKVKESALAKAAAAKGAPLTKAETSVVNKTSFAEFNTANPVTSAKAAPTGTFKLTTQDGGTFTVSQADFPDVDLQSFAKSLGGTTTSGGSAAGKAGGAAVGGGKAPAGGAKLANHWVEKVRASGKGKTALRNRLRAEVEAGKLTQAEMDAAMAGFDSAGKAGVNPTAITKRTGNDALEDLYAYLKANGTDRQTAETLLTSMASSAKLTDGHIGMAEKMFNELYGKAAQVADKAAEGTKLRAGIQKELAKAKSYYVNRKGELVLTKIDGSTERIKLTPDEAALVKENKGTVAAAKEAERKGGATTDYEKGRVAARKAAEAEKGAKFTEEERKAFNKAYDKANGGDPTKVKAAATEEVTPEPTPAAAVVEEKVAAVGDEAPQNSRKNTVRHRGNAPQKVDAPKTETAPAGTKLTKEQMEALKPEAQSYAKAAREVEEARLGRKLTSDEKKALNQAKYKEFYDSKKGAEVPVSKATTVANGAGKTVDDVAEQVAKIQKDAAAKKAAAKAEAKAAKAAKETPPAAPKSTPASDGTVAPTAQVDEIAAALEQEAGVNPAAMADELGDAAPPTGNLADTSKQPMSKKKGALLAGGILAGGAAAIGLVNGLAGGNGSTEEVAEPSIEELLGGGAQAAPAGGGYSGGSGYQVPSYAPADYSGYDPNNIGMPIQEEVPVEGPLDITEMPFEDIMTEELQTAIESNGGYTMENIMASYQPYIEMESANIDAQAEADITAMREDLAARGILNSDLEVSLAQAIRGKANSDKQALYNTYLMKAQDTVIEYQYKFAQLDLQQQQLGETQRMNDFEMAKYDQDYNMQIAELEAEYGFKYAQLSQDEQEFLWKKYVDTQKLNISAAKASGSGGGGSGSGGASGKTLVQIQADIEAMVARGTTNAQVAATLDQYVSYGYISGTQAQQIARNVSSNDSKGWIY